MCGMAKVDERAPTPKLDDEALERLRRALDRDGVVAALLIGSHARGTPGTLSDVDVGVWMDPGLSSKERFDLRLELIGAATSAVRSDEVDLVPLNDAPPLMKQRAIRDGTMLIERDAVQRVRLDTAAIVEYLDTAPLRAIQAQARRRRLNEGTFGRR
jgi:predicted nucleotidyltransferase